MYKVFVTLSTVSLAVVISLYFYKKRKLNEPPKNWKAVGRVSKLHLYPLKSGRRIELNSANCNEFGITQTEEDEKVYQLRDRSFIIYGENNEFKTARTFPKLMQIDVAVHDESHVVFNAPEMRSLYVKVPSKVKENRTITMFHNENVYCLDCGDEAAEWISRFIKGESNGLRIGFHDAVRKNRRRLDNLTPETFAATKKEFKYLRTESMGLYSDLSAIHLVNQSSVDDLNERIKDSKIVVENFRPNITTDGVPPYEEDDWDWIKIGDVIFRNVKPCTRCIMTTIDQETCIRHVSREPLKTLEGYRKLKHLKKGAILEAESPVMGINLEVNTGGMFNVGDTVYVAA